MAGKKNAPELERRSFGLKNARAALGHIGRLAVRNASAAFGRAFSCQAPVSFRVWPALLSLAGLKYARYVAAKESKKANEVSDP
jgi:hypothetical protein